ncbi:MAG TPA: T9SS type A sorting domain-containing protein [Rubricoccaceae bacterium]|jgi:hypothetical protein
MKRLLLLAAGLAPVLAAPAATAQTTAWINELTYDNSSANDPGEAIEVVLPAGIPAALYSVVLYNGGATGGVVPYAPNGTRPGGGAYTAAGFNVGSDCPAGASYDINGDTVNDYTFYTCAFPASTGGGGFQNGGPDGLALVGPDPVNPAYPLVQYLSYEGTQGASSGPAAGQISQDIGVAENNTTTLAGTSLQVSGTGAAYENFAWQASQASTFGTVNAGQTLTLGTPTAASMTFGSGDGDDLAGYRQLAAPVAGLRVANLASVNLVQGVPGSAPFAAQYPDASPNLFTAFVQPSPTGDADGYVPPTNTAQGLGLGRGFFWYFYDQTLSPNPASFGGGTSQSVALPQTATLTGIAVTPVGTTGPTGNQDLRVTFSANASEVYLLGNPLNGDFALSGVNLQTSTGGTTTAATLGTNFQVFDPSLGTFTVVTGSLARGQGAFAQVSGVAATTAVRTFGFDFDVAGTGGTFIGRSAATQVALALDGQTTAGTAVHDRAAIAQFSANAQTGWDAGDATKLSIPGTTTALVAFVGETPAERFAVRSLPTPAEPTTLDVAFATETAGSFELSADVPAGWSAVLTDRIANTTADLAAGSYAFTAEAGDWATRFSLTVAARGAVAGEAAPAAFSLGSVFPNPATSAARVALRVDAAQTVTATVVDALGRTVQTVFEGALTAGASQDLTVDTTALAPGVYVVRVTGETFTATRRLVVAR